MSLVGATRSEITKQFSTALWWILAIVLFLYVALMSGGLAFAVEGIAHGLIPGEELPLPADQLPLTLYSFAASLGYVFALLIGTIMVTSEFRHKTLTITFLATPRRGSALLAKVTAGALMGLLYAVIAIIAVLPAAAVVAGFGDDPLLGSGDAWAMFGRILLALVLWTIMGIGIGALIRNQIAAIVAILVFTQLIEPILRLVASLVEGAGEAANYLPGAASDILVGASFSDTTTAVAANGPEWWVGAIVLAAYSAFFLLLGWLTSWRRDVA